MVHVCAALDCKYKVDKNSKKSTHRFPFKKPELLAKWLINMGREGWYPCKSSILCSDHFEKHCFSSEGERFRLKQDAIPTIFKKPPDSKKGSKKKKKENPLSTIDEILDKNHKLLKTKVEKAKNRATMFKKKLNCKQVKISRLQKLVASLNEKIGNLQDDLSFSEGVTTMLKNSASNVPRDLLLRMLKNQKSKAKVTKESYPQSLRTFAVTLHLYSTLAYDYVRSAFDSALPHPSQVRQWYDCVVDELGIMKEGFGMKKDGQEENSENSDGHENSEDEEEKSFESVQKSSENLPGSSTQPPENPEPMQQGSSGTIQQAANPNFMILSELIDYLRN